MYVISEFVFAVVIMIFLGCLFWRICYEEGMDEPD